MSLKIIWSDKAKSSFKTTVSQIDNKWSFKIASDFVKKANKIIESVSNQPYLFPVTRLEDVRKAVITKQTSLLYKVHQDHTEILFFWDNRQEPSF
jgi:plasmid stabilization system protein ParE